MTEDRENPYEAYGDEDAYIDSFDKISEGGCGPPNPPSEYLRDEVRRWWGYRLADALRLADRLGQPRSTAYAEHFTRLALSKP